MTQRAPEVDAHTVFWSTVDGVHRALADRLCCEYGEGDFDPTFLGFLDTYLALSRIIPRDRVVYDVGCAYAFQAWFFRDHRAYVGISDSPPVECRFATANTRHVRSRIEDWDDSVDSGHFAIHNYCPGGRETVMRRFTNLFTFYPTLSFRGYP